jgi:hypothetical protein
MSDVLLRVAQGLGVLFAGGGGVVILAAFARKRRQWIRPGTVLLLVGLVLGVAASIAANARP